MPWWFGKADGTALQGRPLSAFYVTVSMSCLPDTEVVHTRVSRCPHCIEIVRFFALKVQSFPGHHQRPYTLVRNKHLILTGDLERTCTAGAFNMPLRMPHPMKRQGSSTHQLIPTDVLARPRGIKLTIPVGYLSVAKTISPKDVDIRVSLHTRDPQQAGVVRGWSIADGTASPVTMSDTAMS